MKTIVTTGLDRNKSRNESLSFTIKEDLHRRESRQSLSLCGYVDSHHRHLEDAARLFHVQFANEVIIFGHFSKVSVTKQTLHQKLEHLIVWKNIFL